MKEKKTNESPSKSDSWLALQSELGLLSSPVEHDQVTVVKAADPRDATPQTDETPWENLNHEASSLAQDKETVVVNTDFPGISEQESDSWDVLSRQKTDDLFGFGDFGDCDIPKNAFASPKKAKSSQQTEMVAPAPAEEPLQDFPVSALGSKGESAESETPFDPLLSDELPTSLWQPRKPAPVFKKKAGMPVFPGNSSPQPDAQKVERQPESRHQVAEAMPVDDLAKHSSGKKRHDRSRGTYEKFDDRHPREPSQGDTDRSRREVSYRESGNKQQRRHTADVQQVSFENPVFNDIDIDPSYNGPAWEPKPQSRGKNRKFDKPDVPAEDASFAFADRDRQEGFAVNLERFADDDQDWLHEGGESKKTEPRTFRKNRQRNFPDETSKADPEHGTRNAFDIKEAGRDRYSREERKPLPPPPPSRQPATSQPQHRAKSPVAESPTQKIVVAGWDDAVRDIIEKNMQRRPVTKNDRQGNSRGRRH
ncbi:MAG: hypothetical protein FWH27_03145 [Planctomycetaceae bacterium]|nr:hypothetical protein [Planctomycetaceae bacterium]